MKTLLIIILICFSGVTRAQVWTQVFGPLGEDVEAILADETGRVFIGTDTAAFSSFDNGATWQWDTIGLDAPDEFSFVEMRDGTLLTGTELEGIYRSSDYGLHWQDANVGLPDSVFVPGIVCDSSQELFAAVSSHGIYYSSDEGVHWELRSNGLQNDSIFSLTLSPNGDLYAGLKGFIVRSTDHGLDWTVCDTLQPSDEVLALGADSIGDIFAGIFPGMILRSRDQGETWDTISPMQPLAPVRCIATAGGSLFAGTYGSGVWKSTDVGDHWTQMASGLTDNNLMVLCCTIAPDSDMFIGTLDEAVFRANISSASSVPSPGVVNESITFSSEQSPLGVMLHFDLPIEQMVHLSVYDLTGRKRGDLCNGLFSAGDHVALFDNRQTDHGTYFAVLTTPSCQYVQRFIAEP